MSPRRLALQAREMHPIPDSLHGRPFTTAQAARVGVTRRMLQGSRFVCMRRGVYRTRQTPPTHRLDVQAALLVLPQGSVASHTTALRLLGLDIGAERPLHFSISTSPEIDRDDIVLHRRLRRLHPVMTDDIPALGPRRTFVDVATILSQRDLLAVGDWLVAQRAVDLLDLRGYVIASHLDGVRKARRIAPLVRENVASVSESYVRWELRRAGLPDPELNVDIVNAHGAWMAKGDLVFRRWKVLVEYDGWHHERDARQRQWDHLRRESLEAAGWRVIVVTAEDMRSPRTVAIRVRQALQQRAA